MANFCHDCAQRVSPSMRVCPNCGVTLVVIAPRPATTTMAPPRPDAGGYTPNLSGLHTAAPRGERPRAAEPVVPPEPTAARGSSVGGPPRADFEATPPASTSPYARADVGPRLVAWLVDLLVGFVALVPGAVLFAMGYAANEDEGMMVMGGITFFAGIAWALWYGFTKDGSGNGQSIGKRHAGLMVVHLPSNTPCTRAQSAIRAIVAIVCNVVPAIGWLIEPVMVLVGEDGRRLGDRAAETQVIMAREYPAERTAA